MNRKTARGRGGFTLLEMMAVVGIFTIFCGFIFSTIAGATRVSMMESIRLNMDGSANEILQRIAETTRDAILPIRNISDSTSAFRTLINGNDGFGANAAAWERHLFAGSNFLAFCISVDGDGTGDRLDGDMIPFLGVNRPPVEADAAIVRNGYAVACGAIYNNNFQLQGGVNPGLSGLTPGDLQNYQLPANNGSYAVIRFVPFIDAASGNPAVLTETAANCDFNEDGALDAIQYHIGGMGIYYPPVDFTDPATDAANRLPRAESVWGGDNMVLVPASGNNGGNNALPAVFTLVQTQKDGSVVPGTHGSYDAIRVQLTMFNFDDMGYNPSTPNASRAKYRLNWDALTTRRYESLINLRSLTY